MNILWSLLVAAVALIAVALMIVLPGRNRDSNGLAAHQRRHLARTLPWYRQLDNRRRRRLEARTVYILAHVEFIEASGHTLTAAERLTIAGQMGLFCLGAHTADRRLPTEIAVYARQLPATIDPPRGGVIEDLGELAAGSAWQAARLSLIWPEVEAALSKATHNPVIRGIARLQDFAVQTAAIDGTNTWVDAFQAQHRALVDQPQPLIAVTEDMPLNEFFGSAAEAFFQRGQALAEHHPSLYAILAAYFDIETARSRPSGHRTPITRYRS